MEVLGAARSIDAFFSSRRAQGFTEPLVIFILGNLIHKHINDLKQVQMMDTLLSAQPVLQDYDSSKNGKNPTKQTNTHKKNPKQKNMVLSY